MTEIQSQINVIEARIKQYETLDIPEDKKERLIKASQIELEKYLLKQAKEIEVNHPEQL